MKKLLFILLGLFPSLCFGATNFTCTVNTVSGGDYSSLSLWEGAIDDNLTTAVVLSHSGITGTVADGATVTGATSLATGTCRHATSTQIMIAPITGTFQNGEQIYSLINVNYVNSTSAPDSVIAVVNCAGTNADTTAVNVIGWVAGASNQIKIYGDYVPPTSGSLYSTSYYRLETTTLPFQTEEDYVFVDKLQVRITASSGGSNHGIQFNTGNECRLSNSIVKAVYTGTGGGSGIIYVGQASEVCYVWNNVFIDIYNASVLSAAFRHITAGTLYAYSNTVHTANYGIRASVSGGIVAKNNILQSCNDNEYVNGTLASTSGNNISESATQAQLVDVAQGTSYVTDTTDGTSASKLIDSGVNFTTLGIKVGNIVRNTTDTTFSYVTAIDSSTQLSLAHNIMVSGEGYIIYTNLWGAVTFVDEANDNFLLGSTDTIAINNGIDTSGESAPLNFTTDIQGESRATWDVGADEFVAAGGAARRVIFIN